MDGLYRAQLGKVTPYFMKLCQKRYILYEHKIIIQGLSYSPSLKNKITLTDQDGLMVFEDWTVPSEMSLHNGTPNWGWGVSLLTDEMCSKCFILL